MKKMKIEFRESKSIITKSSIPSIDYVINPYIGCQHGCIYCYAEFMIRFTNHKGDKWGEFLDIKTFNPSQIKPQRYDGKRILLSSVTDPYLPLERKYLNTRRILESLVGTSAEISVLTKSKLVIRDIDLFKKFKNIEVGISISTLNEDFARIIEERLLNLQNDWELLKKFLKPVLKPILLFRPFFQRLQITRQ